VTNFVGHHDLIYFRLYMSLWPAVFLNIKYHHCTCIFDGSAAADDVYDDDNESEAQHCSRQRTCQFCEYHEQTTECYVTYRAVIDCCVHFY